MPTVMSSPLTLVTFILVVVVTSFKSLDQFFFKTFQTLGLGVRFGVRFKD